MARESLGGGIAASHDSLFKPTPTMWNSFKDLYLDQLDSYKAGKPAKPRPGGEMCEKCSKFHLNTLKDIDKDQDIKLGQGLETCFLEFINAELVRREISLICKRADGYVADEPDHMHMPDFKLINKNGDAQFYFEFKAIFRPFITICRHR